jgi:enoyl-CoA hydratase
MLNEVLRGFTQLPCVTIAAIDGPALGAGAQLVVACDVRVATPTSVIGVPAAKLGLVVNHRTHRARTFMASCAKYVAYCK